MATYTTSRGRADIRYSPQDFNTRRPPVVVVDRPRSPAYDPYRPTGSAELVVDCRSVSRGALRPDVQYRGSSRGSSRSYDYNDESISVSRSRSRSRNRCRPGSDDVEISKTTVVKYDEPPYRSPPRHRHRNDIEEIDIQIIQVGNNTWVRVNIRHICPETLDHFGYRWEWDSVRLPRSLG